MSKCHVVSEIVVFLSNGGVVCDLNSDYTVAPLRRFSNSGIEDEACRDLEVRQPLLRVRPQV